MTKLKDYDAVYLRLLAFSALEHRGIIMNDLNDLTGRRMDESRQQSRLQW